MKLLPALGLIAVLVAVTGCASTASTSEIGADGTYTRTVKLSVAKNGMSDKQPKIADVFDVPSGDGWTTKKEDTEENIVLACTKKGKLGDPTLTDIHIKEKDGYMLKNNVAFRELGPGRYEYRETFTWQGKKQAEDAAADASFFKDAKAALGDLATDESVKRLWAAVQKETWKLMFGPGDPMISSLFANPEYAARKLRTQIMKILDRQLAAEYGDKLSDDKRHAVVLDMLKDSNIMDSAKPKKPSQESTGDESAGMIPMFASIKLPGKIVETNGEVDEISGEVFWSLYPEAAQMGPVSIYAICEKPPGR